MTDAAAEPAGPRPPRAFSRFERLLAIRYLLPKRREGFIAVITLLSLIGVMIGVAALIVVLSVMKGFRHELVNNLVGINGHIFVYRLKPMPCLLSIIPRWRTGFPAFPASSAPCR